MNATETVGAGDFTSPEPTPPAGGSVEGGRQSPFEISRGRRKVREGIVVSDKMDRTRIVLVQEQKPHALYKKVVRINRRLKVDDATNEAHVGDRVRIAETRPLSKDKRWRLDAVLEKAK